MGAWEFVCESFQGVCNRGSKIAVAVGTAIGFFLGGFDTWLQVLICFAVLDFVTGVVSAWVNQELSSEKAFQGAWKKVLMFVVVGVANLVDLLLGQTNAIRMGAIALYVWTEAVSLVENAGRAGLPMPDGLIRAIKVLEGKAKPEAVTSDIPPDNSN